MNMLCLAICMYLLVLAYWTLDILILRKELMVFLPEQLSSTSKLDVYRSLTQMLGAHWYAQALLQVLIVSGALTVSCIPFADASIGIQWAASDIVALWRAYIVFGRARWLKITTVIVLFIEVGKGP